MTPALLLVDLQNDYLDREDLFPAKADLAERCHELLAGWRARSLPVVHARTIVDADGTNRMPHWRRTGHWACVAGTPGCAPPAGLAEVGGETVVAKPFFSAFSSPDLEYHLRAAGADAVVLAGAYLHACVQATALDAYQRGFEVWIAADAVATYTPHQMEVSTEFLADRAATLLPTAGVLTHFA